MDISEQPDYPVSDPQTGKVQTLSQRAVRGGLWVVGINVSNKLLSLASLFVLTNLLGSAKWGLLGIASLVISTLNTFTQTGFTAALIQKHDDARDCLDTAWTIELIRGILLCGILWIAAPSATYCFDQDGTLKSSHFRNPIPFFHSLRDPKDPLSKFLYAGLSPEIRSQINSLQPDSILSDQTLRIACNDLNRLMTDGDWDQPDLLSTVTLSPYTLKLIQQSDIPPLRIHRRILQDAYPQWISETVIDRDTIQGIIRLLSLIQVIGAMINIGTIYFKKDLQFHRDFIFTITSYLIETVATITLAFWTRSVWSLVWGKLVGVILKCIFSYFVHPYRPRFRINLEQAWELWTFGQWIFFAGILGFFIAKSDQILVGKLLGPATLGLYVLASKFSYVPATEITTVLTEVTFPAYSKIQNDIPRLRSAFLKVLQLTTFLSVPLSGLVFFLSPDFVRVFFREEWWPMIPVLQILVFRGLVFSIHATFGSIFRAVGKPHITVYLQIARMILMAILLYPMILRWQILGAAIALVIIALAMQPLGYYIVMRILRCSVQSMVRIIWIPLTATIRMVAALYGIRQWICPHQYNIWTLGGLGLAGASLYLLAVMIFEWAGYCHIRPIFTEILQTLLRKRSSQVAAPPSFASIEES